MSKIKEITAYKCTDKQTFSSFDEAEEHQEKLDLEKLISAFDEATHNEVGPGEYEFDEDALKKLIKEGHVILKPSLIKEETKP